MIANTIGIDSDMMIATMGMNTATTSSFMVRASSAVDVSMRRDR
jgi:hypothetical protein